MHPIFPPPPCPIFSQGKCTRLESELRMFQNDCEELVKLCQHQQEQLLHKQTFMQWAFKDRDLDKKFGDMLEGVT